MSATWMKLVMTLAAAAWVALAGCGGEGSPQEDVDSLSLQACTGVNLSASPAGPSNPGTSVLLTATGTTCGVGETAEYRFLYKQEGTAGPYTELQPYSTVATATWPTAGLPSGSYSLIVYARAVGATVGYESYRYATYLLNPVCTAPTLTPTPAAPVSPGTPVSLASTATCTGGSSPEYRYFYRRTGDPGYTEIRAYGPSPASWDTTGLLAGSYSLLVYVRAVGNVSPYEGYLYRAYSLGDSCSSVTLGASPASPSAVGTPVLLTGNATCSGTAMPEYRFYYAPSGQGFTLIRDWGAATVSWPTAALSAGNYTLRVDARATVNGGAAESTGYRSHTLSGLAYGQLVSGVGFHTCSRINDGSVRCWGSNSDGQLGDGTTSNRNTPVAVTGLTGVTQVAAGGFHSCALVSGGTVRCWGSNTDGQLGDGTTTPSTSPVTVAGLTDATAVSAGTYHTCAVRSGGTVACWGDNAFGQIGNGVGSGDVMAPTDATGVTGASAVTAGGWHTCALSGTTLRCWGNNDFGQIGTGSTNPEEPTPLTVTLSSVKAVSAGDSHTCAIRIPSDSYCWGKNEHGQLGNGNTTDRNVPTLISGGALHRSISAGWANTCSAKTDNTLRCWGNNDFGQLGDGTTTPSSVPVTVSGIANGSTVSSGGGLFSCAQLTTNAARCWGYNAEGSLGNGNNTDSSVPVVVLGP